MPLQHITDDTASIRMTNYGRAQTCSWLVNLVMLGLTPTISLPAQHLSSNDMITVYDGSSTSSPVLFTATAMSGVADPPVVRVARGSALLVVLSAAAGGFDRPTEGSLRSFTAFISCTWHMGVWLSTAAPRVAVFAGVTKISAFFFICGAMLFR